MRGVMVVLGLIGVLFSAFKTRSAWQGKSGFPIGLLLGGALLGPLGAGIGSAMAGDDQKTRRGPNVGGLLFYGLLFVIWFAVLLAGIGVLGDVE